MGNVSWVLKISTMTAKPIIADSRNVWSNPKDFIGLASFKNRRREAGRGGCGRSHRSSGTTVRGESNWSWTTDSFQSREIRFRR